MGTMLAGPVRVAYAERHHASALTPKGPTVRNHSPNSPRFSFMRRHRSRLAGIGAGLVAIALLNLPAGAQTVAPNANGDTNYQVTISTNLASVTVGNPVTWTVTFRHTTVTTGTTAGQIDNSASLAVIVPSTLSNVTWQCSASAGSFCTSRNGQAQLASTSGSGSARILPGLALTGAQITLTVIGTPNQIGVARVAANKHDGDGALNDQSFSFGAFADATAIAVGATTTSTVPGATSIAGSTTSTIGGPTTSSVFATSTTNPGPCFVTGFIWFDENGDGVAGAERGIAGVRVSVLSTNPPWSDTNGDGLPRPGEPGVINEAFTDASGTFVSTLLACDLNVRVFFGPLKDQDGSPLALTKQWTVNGAPGLPGLLAPGRLSKFSASGVGAATAPFVVGNSGAKQIDGGLIPPGGVATTTTTLVGVTTTSTVAAPVTTAAAATLAPIATCTPDAQIVSPSGNQSASFKRARTVRITITVASTCKGPLSVQLAAVGLKVTTDSNVSEHKAGAIDHE